MNTLPQKTTKPALILAGDADTPDLPLSVSEVNHLRRLPARLLDDHDVARLYLPEYVEFSPDLTDEIELICTVFKT
jgi:hypothetical protein